MQISSKSFLRTAVVAGAILCIGTGAWAGPENSPNATNDSPFAAAFIGVPTDAVNLANGTQHINFAGVGTVTGMGDCLCESDDEYLDPAANPTMTGTYTLTSEENESVVIRIASPQGKVSQTFASDGSVHVEFSGTFVVVSGTGRYHKATGSGTFTGSADVAPTGAPVNGVLPLTGTGRWALWGTICVKSVPVVTWPAPAAISYGTALSAMQLNATASVPGVFVYSPAAGTVLSAGAHTLHLIFTPTDTAGYSTVTATQTLSVNKAVPVITWPAPAVITHGTALSATQLNATASVPGAFVYSPAAGRC